jgi:hypothetical protein
MPSFKDIAAVSGRVRKLQAQFPDSAASIELAVLSLTSDLARKIAELPPSVAGDFNRIAERALGSGA